MTKFKGTPLFGQDSSPQNTSNILALIGTALLWLTFLICAIFIKPSVKKPKYKEVQIVLSSTSVKEKVKESSAPAQAASEPLSASSETPVAPANEESTLPVQKSSAPAKTEPAKTQDSKPSKTQLTKPVEKKVAAPSPAPTEPTIYKSVEELMAEQMATKKSSSSDYDQWVAMEDDFKENTNETSNTQNTIVNNTTPAFEGTAAQTVAKDEPETSSSSSSSTEKKQIASSGTIKDLSSIKSQTYGGGNAANGIEAETNVKTTNSGSGKVEMVMSNGSSRALLEPSKPVINLSDAASMTIDGSRKVVIQFRVVESGNVPRAEILITPESILSELVRNEIKDQVSKWRFEAADDSATAEFEYKIVKW
ncbi:MAG: hypothetical protein MR424_11710 [Treponema sp.]|nr:hypothetical protein [Treponema sp.]